MGRYYLGGLKEYYYDVFISKFLVYIYIYIFCGYTKFLSPLVIDFFFS